MEELIPRVDLDKLVDKTSICADLRSDAWKVRKEAMETLQGILAANTRLLPKLGEIGAGLKGRLVDTNIMVKNSAIDAIGKIATGMGKPFDKHIKLFAQPVAAILADSKPANRTPALATLTAMATAVGGIEPMIPSFGVCLAGPNPMLRATLIAWLVEQFAEVDTVRMDLTPLMGPIISCVEDRSADVRKQATAILPTVVASVGFDFAMDATSKLKPAMKQTVIPLIQAARSAAPIPASTSSSSTASAPVSAPPTPAKATTSRPASVASVRAPPPAAAPTVIAPPKPRGIMATGSLPTAARPASRASASSNDDGSRYKSATGLRRPASVIASKATSSRSETPAERTGPPPFRTSDPAPKTMRAKKDASKWVFSEKAEQHHTDLLASQMEPHASPELFGLAFSRDHNASMDYLSAIAIIHACFADMAKEAEKFGDRKSVV